jgi:hypothetical protein
MTIKNLTASDCEINVSKLRNVTFLESEKKVEKMTIKPEEEKHVLILFGGNGKTSKYGHVDLNVVSAKKTRCAFPLSFLVPRSFEHVVPTLKGKSAFDPELTKVTSKRHGLWVTKTVDFTNREYVVEIGSVRKIDSAKR